MSQSAQVSPAKLVEAMRQQTEQKLLEIIVAVNSASDGPWINGSEMQVRDLMGEYRQRAFDKALKIKGKAVEATFSPDGPLRPAGRWKKGFEDRSTLTATDGFEPHRTSHRTSTSQVKRYPAGRSLPASRNVSASFPGVNTTASRPQNVSSAPARSARLFIRVSMVKNSSSPSSIHPCPSSPSAAKLGSPRPAIFAGPPTHPTPPTTFPQSTGQSLAGQSCSSPNRRKIMFKRITSLSTAAALLDLPITPPHSA